MAARAGVSHAAPYAHFVDKQALVAAAADWPGGPIKRHNDANHVLYKLSTLADFGVRASDPGMAGMVEAVLDHQSPQGAFQSVVNIPQVFGRTGEDQWTWIVCDAPTLLYSLLAMGLEGEARVRRAVECAHKGCQFCSRRIAISGGCGLDLAIQAERWGYPEKLPDIFCVHTRLGLVAQDCILRAANYKFALHLPHQDELPNALRRD